MVDRYAITKEIDLVVSHGICAQHSPDRDYNPCSLRIEKHEEKVSGARKLMNQFVHSSKRIAGII